MFNTTKVKSLHEIAQSEISKSNEIKSVFSKLKTDLKESNKKLETHSTTVSKEIEKLKDTLQSMALENESNQTVVENIDTILGIKKIEDEPGVTKN